MRKYYIKDISIIGSQRNQYSPEGTENQISTLFDRGKCRKYDDKVGYG
jgi:hypothetical protein